MAVSSIATTLMVFFFLGHFLIRGITRACHVEDEMALLAFKSGITEDPMGKMNGWIAGTDCCRWWGVECWAFNSNRVTGMRLSDGPEAYMSGTISPLLWKLRKLETFSLQNFRNITGTFPRVLFNLPELRYLYIDGAKLSGPLPADLGRLSNLDGLSLSGNRFTGRIPSSISQMTRLAYLVLVGNQFDGNIPIEMGNLTRMNYLVMSHNRFSGQIPDIFSSMSDLYRVDLSYNKLSGNIPPTLGSRESLVFLQLGHNALTGEIPSLGSLKRLDTLDLSSNRLSGVIPPSFKNLTKIFNLDLSRNNLVDPFPSLNIKGIESLDLSYNHFNLGEIPTWVTSSTVIASLKLAGCGLKMKLDDWKPLHTYFYDYIDLSNNEITGSPIGLLNQTDHLVGFWASHNQLKFKMSDLRLPGTLKFLDLSTK